MKGSLAPYKERLLRERKKWKRWQKAVSIMGTLVVFCTAYALILPAVTMGKETYCGQEEHQHSEDCYLLMRRGAATPGNAVPVLPGDIPVSTPSNAEEADPATPSNAGEATGNLPGPGEGNNISGETSKQESLATPGNAQGNKGVASLLLQAEQNLSKQLVSEVKESKYRLHSASNSSQWKKKEEEKTENKYWDLDEDEWYEEDMDLINDLEPEEEEEELEDYVPYEPGMDYDEELYELVMICGKEEHTHSLVCYSDPEADLESEEDWLRTLPQLTGDLPQDIVAVAESQVEYRESEKNYKVEGVDTVKGYTRYGQWYGNPYGDWNGMFASFCVNYAGGEDAPMDADSEGLAEKLKGTVPGLYKERGEYEPSLGDLIFLSDKEEEKLRVGIIKDVTRNEEGSVERVVVIEGDSHDKVGYQTYSLTSGEIQGYGLMSRYGENLITLTAETENAMITAVYEEGALPENVQLQAVEMAKDDERAIEMKEKLTEQGMSQGKVLTTMLPFDITFLDEEGNLVEPSGLIQISAEFKTPVKNEAEATGEDTEEFASQETDSQMTKSGEETEDENIREDEEANEPDIKISAESAKQVSLSANVVTRVGTGIVNESKGQDQAEIEAESQVETTVQTGTEAVGSPDDGRQGMTETDETEPAWELFQMPEDGDPEKISDSESIKIEADEENALYGVTFQSRSSLQWAAAAFAARTGTATEVKTFRELKNALEEEGIKLVVLGADIIVKPAADGDWDIFQAIQMTNEKQHHTLNLNGHTITVEDDNLTLVDIKNGASLTVKDEQETSLEDRESKTTEISEMSSLWHEDGEEVDKESVGKCLENNYNDENRTLEFYVTESNVVDSATGETTESLVKYQIQNPGIIRTTDTRKPQNTFYIEGGTLNWEGGAIVECTNRAVRLAGENSVLNLKGGYICGNTAVLGAGGAIQASGSSRIELSGTYISGNYVTGGNHGGAISLQDAAVLNMSGGYLTNNRADTNGGAVYADGGSLANPGKTSINLTGGYITNNLANFSGGAIFSGGKASDTNPNASTAEKESGSECCLTMKTNDNGISGCIIARNLAIGGEGGGITFRTGTGSIESGYLTNNRTDTREHWGGGGIFYAEEFGLDASEASFAQDVVAKIAALRAEDADDNADGNGDLRAFMSRALKAAKEAGIPGASGAKDGNDYKIENLASGYYVVEDVTEAPTDGSDYAVSALMLDTTTPDAEITIKTDKPSIDKKIVEGEGDNATETNANNAAIGEAVSYKVTSKVPDMTHYNTYTFIVTDTFSKGLTYNKDLTITVGGEVVDASLYEETSETEADGVTKLTINFKDFKANFGKKTGEDIVITYTATVNKDAIIGSAGNKNSVKLTYSNDPNHSGEGDNSTVDTPEVDVFTYVTGLQITKVDATNPDMKLTGAQFKIEGEGLEKALVKGYEFVEDPNGEFYKDGDVYTTSEVEGSKKYSKKEVNKTEESVVKVDYVAEVGEDGVLSLDGLCEGIYTITEVKAPNGYNILKKPIKIQIKCNTDNVTADQTECSWAYRKSDENGDLPNDETTGYVTLDSGTPIIAFDVENTTGVELPSTGGIGTTIFYVLGSILLIGAGVLLVTKKKMAGRE